MASREFNILIGAISELEMRKRELGKATEALHNAQEEACVAAKSLDTAKVYEQKALDAYVLARMPAKQK